MAHPHDDGRQDPADGHGTSKGRRLGRVLIPLAILLVLAAIFTYILVVAQTGDEDNNVNDTSSAVIPLLAERAPALV
ncbi:hypothetical protein ABC795_11555 [Blastococcus sp. HT6-30]|uniref:hypothetical protein n=1 Tax=Blastococcus sp. HT6-30 TaxID=3144843 RepID=UPI003219C2E2